MPAEILSERFLRMATWSDEPMVAGSFRFRRDLTIAFMIPRAAGVIGKVKAQEKQALRSLAVARNEARSFANA